MCDIKNIKTVNHSYSPQLITEYLSNTKLILMYEEWQLPTYYKF